MTNVETTASLTTTGLQAFAAPLTRHAIFLGLRVGASSDAVDKVRDTLADLAGTLESVAFRDPHAHLSCTVGIGSDFWPRLTSAPKPAELRPFTPITGSVHSAVATPGDLFFHIRSAWEDFGFEFERLLLNALGDSVQTVEETAGFRYFDRRDLLGFVDGTANPSVASAIAEALIVGDEDPAGTGGTYIVAQKYLHPIRAWQSLPTEMQEQIIGRTKPDNVELPDATSGQKSHKTLSTIVDAEGVEHDILRDNMPFGSPGSDQFGTYFLGYSRHRWVIQQMLERMFIGDPVGMYDRLLDFSTAITGTAFFAPSADVLGSLPAPSSTADAAAAAPDPAPVSPSPSPADNSLGLGGRPSTS
ncbi:Dyp-type peroxidase [Microbacterium sp. P04]|uniref:Dyp-type peroxidase n=1 Tax=Microbacterium sp. P04 TaxID=3366947 RepID=UPI0037463B1A